MRRLSILLLLTASAAVADEGMWTPDNFPSAAIKDKYGVEIDQAWLDHARLSTVRLSMPDRRQVLPVVASTPDGVEQRTIVLAVERNTKVMEPLVREGNEV